MLVAEVGAFGGPEVLRLAERPDPQAGPGQVVVRVRAANVNPTDLSVRDGSVVHRMPDVTPPVVPGWDVAGEIAEVGEGVSGLAVGQRVAGMLFWPGTKGAVGAYSELLPDARGLGRPDPGRDGRSRSPRRSRSTRSPPTRR